MSKSQTIATRCFLIFASIAAMMLAGCGGEEKQKGSAASQEPVPMKVIKAEAKDMPQWGEFIGQINAVETVDIRARVAGFLQEMKFKEGSQVKKDDLLFTIDPKTFEENLKQAESNLKINEALLSKATKDQARYSALLQEGVVSQTEYEIYQTDFNTYKARVNENRAQVENAKIQLGYTKVYSPIDGIIGRVQVDVGNLVGQNEPTLLATISTVDPVYVNFSINEADYIRANRNKVGSKTRTEEIKMILADGSEYNQNGTFDMADRAVDPQTGTLGIRVTFPNPDGELRPGQYAKIRVLIELAKGAIVVPARGVIDVQGTKSIYKVDKDGKIVSQPIKLGFEAKNLVIVTEGIKAGDMIIADGIRKVRPGMVIKPIVVPMHNDAGEPAPMEDNANKEG
jgi:membrane fusion protein (multidrug efflux system)